LIPRKCDPSSFKTYYFFTVNMLLLTVNFLLEWHGMAKKYLYLLLGSFIAALVGSYSYYHQLKVKSPASLPIIDVEVVEVTNANLPQQIATVGTTIAAERAKLSPELGGVIAKFYADSGQHVELGQPIIQLDDTIYQTQVHAEQIDLIRSQQAYQRIEKLAKSGGESKQDLDNALADLQLKQADLAVKQTQLAKMIIKAPFSGILGERKVSVGEYVAVGEELIDIVNKRNLKVKYTVPERYLAQLQLGQPVTITSSSFAKQTFIGKLSFISPSIDEASGTVLLEATLPNLQEQLAPGLFVQIQHNLGNKQQVAVIPQACLIPTFEGYSVYRVVKGKSIATPVTIGTRLRNWVEISHGLQLGDKVVLAGQQKLKDGSLINSVFKGVKFEAE
jgi:membrane fusion protein (multidrug efflux system)